ncbi:DUF4129 domain-containing protein [Streptomyces sp. S399]|uniref:DUF4129 domain-containing protein n=1 Tax=Streptomyces sp. S399 TaxID=3096009 RepID=UPI0039C38D91
MTDTAWDHGIRPDEALTPRRAAERLVRLAEPGAEAAEAVHRLAGAVEQELYAPRPAPVAGLAEDVGRVRAALRLRASRRTRLRALLLPRSAVRVRWAAADHWGGCGNGAVGRRHDCPGRRGSGSGRAGRLSARAEGAGPHDGPAPVTCGPTVRDRVRPGPGGPVRPVPTGPPADPVLPATAGVRVRHNGVGPPPRRRAPHRHCSGPAGRPVPHVYCPCPSRRCCQRCSMRFITERRCLPCLP